MKFKIEPGSRLYTSMSKLYEEMYQAREAAHRVIASFGATRYIRKHDTVGGISKVYFDEQPKGWKKSSPRGAYVPSVKNISAKEAIANLKVVNLGRISELLKFETQTYQHGGREMLMTRPSVEFRKDLFLVEMNDEVVYKPLKGMVEITTSEYKKLQKRKFRFEE